MTTTAENGSALAELLIKLFNTKELQRLTKDVVSRDLYDSLSWSGSLRDQVDEVAEALVRWGRLDGKLFETLIRQRPYRDVEIIAVAAAYRVTVDPQTAVNAQSLLESLLQIQANHPPNHPIQVFIKAVVAGLMSYVQQGGNHVIELSSHHYKRFVEADDVPPGHVAYAIADLTDRTEAFWDDEVEETDSWVRERIFLLDPEELVDPSRLAQHIGLFEHQRRYNDVFVGDVSMVRWKNHHFGDLGVGAHLLLVERDLVGGYVRREGEAFLRLERNELLYRTAKRRYKDLKRQCVPFSSGMSVDDLRKAWVRARGVGVWDPAWASVDHRAPRYFDSYPLNVKVWIPGYQLLMERCADTVGHVLYDAIKSGKDDLRALEIGFGTGELTRRVLSWADTVNRPVARMGLPRPITEVVGVDASRRMQARIDPLRQEFENVVLKPHFGRWPDTLPAAVTSKRYACIYGSLVLHHILPDPTESDVRAFLRRCAQLLEPGGTLVFTDSFCRPDEDGGRSRIEDWNKHMLDFGLEPETVTSFFSFNEEMKRNVSVDRLRAAAPAFGFEHVELQHVAAPGSPASAFGVLTIR